MSIVRSRSSACLTLSSMPIGTPQPAEHSAGAGKLLVVPATVIVGAQWGAGASRRGSGPAYADQAYRLGIRVQDLLDPKILRQKVEVALAEKNVWLERVYGAAPLELEDLAERHEEYARRLRPYISDTSLLVDRALREGKRALLEGAHGTLLDLDHGTYPFVTSSPPLAP